MGCEKCFYLCFHSFDVTEFCFSVGGDYIPCFFLVNYSGLMTKFYICYICFIMLFMVNMVVCSDTGEVTALLL